MGILTFPSIIPATMDWGLESRTQIFQSPISATIQTLEQVGSSRWTANLSYQNLKAANGRTMMAFLASLKGMAGRFELYNFAHPTPEGIASGSPAVDGADAAVNNGGGYPATTTNIVISGETRIFLVGEYIKFAGHDSVYELVAGTVTNLLVLEAGGLDVAVIDTEVIDVYHQGTTLKTTGWGADTIQLYAGDFFQVGTELKIITETITSVGTDADLIFEPPLRDTKTDVTDLIITDHPKAVMRLTNDSQATQSYRGPMITNCSFNCIEAF